MYSLISSLLNDPFFQPLLESSPNGASHQDTVRYTEGSDTVLEIDVPGSSSNDVEVSAHEGVLHVSWSRKGRSDKTTRRFRLSQLVDDRAITATVKDGVLTVRLPVRAEAQARKIPVLTA